MKLFTLYIILSRSFKAFYHWATRIAFWAAQATILLAFWWILGSMIQKLKKSNGLLVLCK